ncbi:MAG: hypothetical protein AUG46_01375 [Acidobacteria bacterium 13_1_20CM_3_58_11]|nr:MAG: hypothetical protein AUG46_01375 [Acidobacteria bacterium 13_1_20CM_3_58_11]
MRSAKVFGHCVLQNDIKSFDALIGEVMSQDWPSASFLSSLMAPLTRPEVRPAAPSPLALDDSGLFRRSRKSAAT